MSEQNGEGSIFDAGLNDLMAEESARQAEEQLFADTLKSYRDFLASRGILFPRETTVDAAAQRVAAENEASLVFLTAAILSSKYILDDPSTTEAQRATALTVKKKLQAHLVLGTRTGVWIELVDAELPGESLAPNDTELVASIEQQALNTRQKLQEISDNYNETIRGTLSSMGREFDDFSDPAVVNGLHITLFTAQRMSADSPATRQANWLENARSILAKHGLIDNPVWIQVINDLAKKHLD